MDLEKYKDTGNWEEARVRYRAWCEEGTSAEEEACLTNGWSDSERDAVSALFDEVDNISMVQGVDVHMIHRQDPVTNLQPSTTLCRGAWKVAI